MNWRRTLKWLAVGLAAVAGLVLLVAGIQIVRFNGHASHVYDVAPLSIVASTDTAVIARGRHIAESIGGCLACHGDNLGGRLVEDLGPIGVIRSANLTRGRGGVGATSSDGELARAVRHGIRKDGTTLVFMPTEEHHWWPDADVAAVVSYVRSVPPVDNVMEPTQVGALGKLLSEFGMFKLLSARSVAHDDPQESVPAPEPTASYGALLARSCAGCHGEHFSGGRIPGAPSTLPTPANLTSHATGLGSWTKEQFLTVLSTGVRPDGRKLDPFMPIQTTRNMNEVETTALWEFLRSIEPRAFGNR